MASADASNSHQAFDGERLRDLWAPGDGSGDPDHDLIHNSHLHAHGHPTWKLFCGELSDGPPPRVYLDDKAAYDVLQSGRFSGHQRSRAWPFDFGQHGNIRALRPNRGRPAMIDLPDGGEAIATVVKANSSGIYYFYGEEGDPNTRNRKRKRPPGFVEIEQSPAEEPERSSPGPMDLVRQDKVNMAAVKETMGKDMAEHCPNTDTIEANNGSPGSHKRYRADTLVSKPLSHVEQVELDGLRAEYISLSQKTKELSRLLAEAQAASVKANKKNHVYEEEIAEMRHRLEEIQDSRNDENRKLETMRLAHSKLDMEHRVIVKMRDTLTAQKGEMKKRLDALEIENNDLRQNAKTSGDQADQLQKREGELDTLVQIATSLYFHHEEMKKGVHQAIEAAEGQTAEENNLVAPILILADVRDAAVEELADAEDTVKTRGHGDLWNKVIEGMNEA